MNIDEIKAQLDILVNRVDIGAAIKLADIAATLLAEVERLQGELMAVTAERNIEIKRAREEEAALERVKGLPDRWASREEKFYQDFGNPYEHAMDGESCAAELRAALK